MTNRFRHRIRGALADTDLQIALDRYVDRVRTNKAVGYDSLTEDLQSLRERANAVRSQTITKLDDYLQQFCEQASANGMIVHKAHDAFQACRIAVDIAHHNNVHKIVKSKSMVTEEIKLNHALETAGMDVIETDLGEYIIQLRGEGPSHITAPAIHLKREQVGKTFHEKLGMPYTDNVNVMTETARKELRQAFLQADLGISGVNFGVAESGSLCIVTNEGNGRMVTTLPGIHIAVMGIERLVPTFDDLALMLSLLARSATGQKITVYTSIINGPRKTFDDDGPLERHIILIDNGRSALRNTKLQDALHCIRCGACLDFCPVFKELGGLAYISHNGEHTPYPGPIGSIVSPGLFGQDQFGHLAQASTLCGICRDVCPVKIDIPTMLTRVRAGGRQERSEFGSIPDGISNSINMMLRLYTWIASNATRYSLAQRTLAALSRLSSPHNLWIRLPAFTSWGALRRLPRPATHPFRTRWREGQQIETGVPTPHSTDPQISKKRDPGADRPILTESMPDSSSGSIDLIKRFEQEVIALGSTFDLCSAGQLNTRIVAFLRQKDARKISAWEKDQLPFGVIEAVQVAGVEIMQGADPDVTFGITGAIAGIAETGTLILTSGRGRPLTTSLLPEIHLVILRTRDIYPDLQDAVTLPLFRENSFVVLISGPSRTADIEMTLALGVHGPKELHIFCIDDTQRPDK